MFASHSSLARKAMLNSLKNHQRQQMQWNGIPDFVSKNIIEKVKPTPVLFHAIPVNEKRLIDSNYVMESTIIPEVSNESVTVCISSSVENVFLFSFPFFYQPFFFVAK